MNNNQSMRKLKRRIALLLVVSFLTFVVSPLCNGSSWKAKPLEPLVPTPTSSSSPTPEPAPSPPYIPTFIRRVNLQANSLVYSEATQALYASVQSREGGPRGNSITRITPATGEIGPSVFLGSEPDRMAISSDGRTIWTHLNGINAVRQFDAPSQTAGLQFFTGSLTPQPPLDMDVVPGHPLSVVLSRGFSEDSAGSVVVFDSGIKRPNIANTSSYGPIEFGADPSILYGAFKGGLIRFLVDSFGVTQLSVTEDLWPLGLSSFKCAGGLVYASTGAVVDPESNVLLGTFQGVNSSAMAVDTANHRVFYLTGSGSGVVLQAFDSDTFLPIGSLTLPGVSGAPVSLVRWGTNGLAFNTTPSFNSSDPNQVYILQTEFVSNVDPIPTGIQVETGFLSTSEGSSTLPIKVLRTGDVSGSVSVNYATGDGTATAGLDYTTTSGTLSFAPGELTKFISIPISNDNLFENGDETFNLTLSGPTNSAILLTPAGAIIILRDDDSKPVVTFPSLPTLMATYIDEADSGTKNLTFQVFLTNPSVQDVSVAYATTDFQGTPVSATAGSDYVASSGTITIPAGTTLATGSISIIG
ncbi:MAG TPA: Calx-beta domain-containing protein, partial [Pyrinomonadaceae bacterium]|nr:Calx-beta domain-containing protein [Pyrinomonadaceae bacterium]